MTTAAHDDHGGHQGGPEHPRLQELQSMVRDGRIDTLIVAITDMQGRLMGKRVQAQAFLNGVIDHGAHFCTYLLGTDMEMNTPDGFALNGKLLQSTYDEWKASRFARQGVQCQDCHMPDRRHRWRGIHDADMVRSGLTITADGVEYLENNIDGTIQSRLLRARND